MDSDITFRFSLPWLLAGSLALGTLSGCSGIPAGVRDLPQPRPIVDQESDAYRIMYDRMAQFRAEARYSLAIDTAVWEDEGEQRGGFDPMTLGEALTPYSDSEVTSRKREILWHYGTVPRPLRDATKHPDHIFFPDSQVKSSETSGASSGASGRDPIFDTTASVGIGESGSTSLHAFGAGLFALDILSSFEPVNPDRLALKDLAKALYGNRSAALELTDKERPGFDKAASKHRYVAALLVSKAADVLRDKGFEPDGSVLFTDEVAYQVVVNETLGCSRPADNEATQTPSKFCRISFPMGERFFVEELNGRILGGFYGKAGAFMSAGFQPPLPIFGGFKAFYESGRINEELYHELPRRHSGVMTYFPSENLPNEVRSPQYVVDKDGVHYFVVKVKRSPEVKTTAQMKD